jgi:hypothetical protein
VLRFCSSHICPLRTSIKYKDIALELSHLQRAFVQEVRTEGDEAIDRVRSEEEPAIATVRNLRGIAESYDTLRSRIPAGGRREVELEKTLKTAERVARTGVIDIQTVRDFLRTGDLGDHIIALGVMRVHPELRDFDLVAEAIDNPHRGFDQDRLRVLAAEMLLI